MAISLLITACFLAIQCVDAKLCRIRSLGGERSIDCMFGCCYTTSYTCCQQPVHDHTWFIVSVVVAAGSTMSVVVVILTVVRRKRQLAAASVEQPTCVVGPRAAPSYTVTSGHIASGHRNFTFQPVYSVQPASRCTPLHPAQFAHARTTPMDSPPAYTEQPSAIPLSSAQTKPSGAETLPSTTARHKSDGSFIH
ncbi:hypothetical protein BsWGS_22602 [Bradybaena similaris]